MRSAVLCLAALLAGTVPALAEDSGFATKSITNLGLTGDQPRKESAEDDWRERERAERREAERHWRMRREWEEREMARRNQPNGPTAPPIRNSGTFGTPAPGFSGGGTFGPPPSR